MRKFANWAGLMTKVSTREYNTFENVNTGTRYNWVDTQTWYSGFVQVCTDAGSIYVVRVKNLKRIVAES